MDIDDAKRDLGYEPEYSYIDYLRDYKKERHVDTVEEIEKIVMIVDSIDDAQLLVSCLKETSKEKVGFVCINGDVRGTTEMGCPVVGIAEMPPLDQSFFVDIQS